MQAAQSIIDPKKLGFNTREDAAGDYKRMKSNVMNEVKLIFRPEFLNRIDEILVFHPLSQEEMKKIVGMMCKDLVKRAKEQLDISLTIRDSVKKHIVEPGRIRSTGHVLCAVLCRTSWKINWRKQYLQARF